MPRLTEQEQQAIIRYLAADKPLPDKYRFLIFENKREAELVRRWRREVSLLTARHKAPAPYGRRSVPSGARCGALTWWKILR